MKKLGDIERMIKENYDLAIALANKSLYVANLDIVSSSIALRFLCRAELLNKNYDFAKVVELLKMSLREQDLAFSKEIKIAVITLADSIDVPILELSFYTFQLKVGKFKNYSSW